MAKFPTCANMDSESNKHLTNHSVLSPTPMGNFDKLPAEIRRQIYFEFFCKDPFDRRLLKVNNRFYTEYLELLQKHYPSFGTLHLHVDPSRHPSTVQVSTQWGRLLITIDAASSHLELDTNPIRSLPIGRYAHIKIHIHPPNPKDPGQALRLGKQILAITTSLSPSWYPSTCLGIPTHQGDVVFPAKMEVSESLPQIRIIFETGPRRSWVTDNAWNKSLRDYGGRWNNRRFIGETGTLTDAELVLTLLQRLRRVSVMKISFPVRPNAQTLKDCKRIQALVQDRVDFGLKWCRGTKCRRNDLSDHDILAKINSIQVWHEFLLDDLPGRTANLLRQERFLKWCTAYERQHCQALCGVPGRYVSGPIAPQRLGLHIAGACERLDWDLCVLIDSTFHSRFWARMACDLNDPSGIERKSKNKLWTEFSERPKVKSNTSEGFTLSTDSTALPRWQGCSTKCGTCTIEDHENRVVLSHKDAHELQIRKKPRGWATDVGDNGLWDTGYALQDYPFWITASLRETERTLDGWRIWYNEGLARSIYIDDERNPPRTPAIWSFTSPDWVDVWP